MQDSVPPQTIKKATSGRDSSGSLWLVQALSGLILVGILGLHMVAHHYVVEGGLRNYEQVLDFVSNPAIFFTEIAFVILATVHALLGVRSILFDLRPGLRTGQAINWMLGIAGAVAIIYGIWLAVGLQQLAAA